MPASPPRCIDELVGQKADLSYVGRGCFSDPGAEGWVQAGQALEGSFSAVTKPILASKQFLYFFKSTRFAHLCTAPNFCCVLNAILFSPSAWTNNAILFFVFLQLTGLKKCYFKYFRHILLTFNEQLSEFHQRTGSSKEF